jgi:hypothetical protein
MEYVGTGGNFLPRGGPEGTPEPGDGAPAGRTAERSRDGIPRRKIILKGVKPHPVHGNAVELTFADAIARRYHPNRDSSAHEGTGQCAERGAGKVA